MARTTLDIDPSVMGEIRVLAARRHKAIGEIVSELLAEALAGVRAGEPACTPEFRWSSREMGALVDLEDREAVWAALDREE
ncbi:MAG: antitoxin [Thermoflexaceae bacterium]|nr:antitoxin [Thermoflexaceae bacterium]